MQFRAPHNNLKTIWNIIMLLHSYVTIWNMIMILHSYVEQVMTMCRVQEWQLSFYTVLLSSFDG